MSDEMVKDHIARLPEGGTAMVRFHADGSASIKAYGFWIDVEGTFEPGDTAGVVSAYTNDMQELETAMLEDFNGIEGIEATLDSIEHIDVPDLPEIAEAMEMLDLDGYEVDEDFTILTEAFVGDGETYVYDKAEK